MINARADTFIQRVADPVDAAIERGRLYLAAGADCVYPIGAPMDAVPALVKGLPGPVNANNPPGTSLADLAEAGVARVSYGPTAYRRALGNVQEFAARVHAREDPYA